MEPSRAEAAARLVARLIAYRSDRSRDHCRLRARARCRRRGNARRDRQPGFLFAARAGRGDGPSGRRRTSCRRRRARRSSICRGMAGRASTAIIELPVVDAARNELKRDFAPFAALKDLPMAMSAHVLYTAIDRQRPATASPIVVEEIMRGEIGFDGLILSDDVSMKALKGPYDERAAAVIGGGPRYRPALQRRTRSGSRGGFRDAGAFRRFAAPGQSRCGRNRRRRSHSTSSLRSANSPLSLRSSASLEAGRHGAPASLITRRPL